jgi:hypothetical protein
MSEIVTKSVTQKQQNIEKRTVVERIGGSAILPTGVALLVLVVTAVYAQVQNSDKYSLKSPSGIAFSDFRGYEDWSVVSSARTDEVLKVIVANPKMINAYKAGVPGNSQIFPDGYMIVKAPVEAEEEHRGPIRRGCARRL